MVDNCVKNGIPDLAGQEPHLYISGLVCGFCGAHIKPKGKWKQIYCSARCRAWAHHKKKEDERERFLERVQELMRELEGMKKTN